MKIPVDELRVELLPLHDGIGQKVRPSPCLIRVTHIPTGMSITVSDRKGQFYGRSVALTLLEMVVDELG